MIHLNINVLSKTNIDEKNIINIPIIGVNKPVIDNGITTML
ncbi:hypothetical protein [Spiroplasma turonicum]|nr:hypothetical protein [Spiroplasma turonicum]